MPWGFQLWERVTLAVPSHKWKAPKNYFTP